MDCNFRTLLEILYPRLCLHCETSLDQRNTLFCSLCLEQLSLIDCQTRCRSCFVEKEEHGSRCLPVATKRRAAACPAFGPALTLASTVQRGQMPYLKALCALLHLQFLTLQWPPPDLVIPTPRSFVSHLLAKEMSRLLDRPYLTPLKISWDWRAFLEKGQWCTAISCKKKASHNLGDKRILLIALHLEDPYVQRAAETLREEFATEIYALAFTSE